MYWCFIPLLNFYFLSFSFQTYILLRFCASVWNDNIENGVSFLLSLRFISSLSYNVICIFLGVLMFHSSSLLSSSLLFLPNIYFAAFFASPSEMSSSTPPAPIQSSLWFVFSLVYWCFIPLLYISILSFSFQTYISLRFCVSVFEHATDPIQSSLWFRKLPGRERGPLRSGTPAWDFDDPGETWYLHR